MEYTNNKKDDVFLYILNAKMCTNIKTDVIHRFPDQNIF